MSTVRNRARNSRDDLQDVARSHSKDMATEGDVGHTEPDGTTIEDRYREHGIDCRAMGENVAQSWYRVETDVGYFDTVDGFAKAVVQ